VHMPMDWTLIRGDVLGTTSGELTILTTSHGKGHCYHMGVMRLTFFSVLKSCAHIHYGCFLSVLQYMYPAFSFLHASGLWKYAVVGDTTMRLHSSCASDNISIMFQARF
jgi:hypothetical protein